MKFSLIYCRAFKILGGFFFSLVFLFVVIEAFSFSPNSVMRLVFTLPMLLLAGFLLWYMGKTSAIIIDSDSIIVKLLISKKILFSSVIKTELKEIKVGKYQTIKILALLIWYGDDKKIKIHLDKFENHKEFLKMLGEKIGEKLAKQIK